MADSDIYALVPEAKNGREVREALRDQVEKFLRKELGDAELVVSAFDTESSNAVFSASLSGGGRLFVKPASAAEGERLKRLYEEIDLPFVAKEFKLFPWKNGVCIVCQEWQEGEHIPPERMNEAQCASLAEAYMRFSAALKPGHANRRPRDISGCHATVCGFARRHPFARPFLSGLLSIPEAERDTPPEKMVVAHGDFHYLNCKFAGDRVSAIVDFASTRKASPAHDMVYMFARRYYKAKLKADEKKNLDARFRQIVAALPYSVEDWRTAINEWRLVFAMRRLKAHPRFWPVAILVAKRDRPLRRMLALL